MGLSTCATWLGVNTEVSTAPTRRYGKLHGHGEQRAPTKTAMSALKGPINTSLTSSTDILPQFACSPYGLFENKSLSNDAMCRELVI